MITMIARMRVLPEKAAAYEELMTSVAATTLREESGVPYYAWARSAAEPGVYVVVEVYEDEKAHAAHMASEWVTRSLPIAMGLIEGRPDIRQYVSPGQEPVALRHG